ncbi:hypothetical protein Taro_021096 [Colocasia esculenta]|uniref:Exocyst complex component Sec10-like alpha-helical bundle domain-containing protein n=1 Tax=Colocasia esculenta TaxID=4460 RepID=A0A843V1G7_COLES|nr:hypothetical protein [Colocasia esculenta]
MANPPPLYKEDPSSLVPTKHPRKSREKTQRKRQETSAKHIAPVERLLSSEQKTTDYRSPDDGNAPDHRPTTTCINGGLRLKRDITEYGEFVRSFNAPSVDEKFELLGIVANVFIVAPESLASLFEGNPSIRKDALRFIQLREDFKSAKISSRLNAIMAES